MYTLTPLNNFKQYIFYTLLFCCVLCLVLTQTTEYAVAEEPFCEPISVIEVKDLKSIESLSLQVPGYPVLGGDSLDTIAEDSSLSSLVAYFYRFSLAIAGVIAFLSLLYAGILFILSGDSPDTRRRAVSKVKKVFIGVFILLSAVLIFEFIGLDINATNNLDLEVKKVEGEVVLPKGKRPSLRTFKQSTQGHIYYGIPYTNAAGIAQTYNNLQPDTAFSSECFYCDGSKDGPNNPDRSCFFMCTQNNVRRTIERNDEMTYKDYNSLYLQGRDRIKDCLQNKTDVSSIVYVWDDDDTPVSCAAACMAISDDQGSKCKTGVEGNTYEEKHTKAFYDWLKENQEDNKNYITEEAEDDIEDERGEWVNNYYEKKIYRIRGTRPSPSDSFFQDFISLDRSGFRTCIGNKYVLDAQEFDDFDICLCGDQPTR